MQGYFLWLVAGFILVIAELVTGTFYLLVLGIAAFAGAAVAWAGGSFALQAVVAAAVALAGTVWVHRWRGRTVSERMPALDLGQPAVFEGWTNQEAGLARVKYRNALWDAVIEDDAQAAPGEIFYIAAVDGNRLKLSRKPP